MARNTTEPMRRPEGRGPDAATARWSWLFLSGLVAVMIGVLGYFSWMVQGWIGVTVIVGLAALVGLLRMWPVLAAEWFRSQERSAGMNRTMRGSKGQEGS